MNKKKQIAFILPGFTNNPIGGYKIAYQYADLFSEDDYEVHVIFNALDKKTYDSCSCFSKIKKYLGLQYRNINRDYFNNFWFSFKNKIIGHEIFQIKDCFLKFLSSNAIIVATSVETAYPISELKRFKNKLYLIQDFENWKDNTDDFVLKSYTLGLKNIVISNWLKEKVESTGAKAKVIPNGLDFEYFKLSNPIENRSPFEICLLYHNDDRKRVCDSLAALYIVKEKIPELHVNIFGVPERPENLPEWFNYVKCPDRITHNHMYNTSSIFVAASMKEGWGLPLTESLQCGCALVCTDIGGFADYAINGKTALTSPVYDVNKLAENILILINDNKKRIELARAGNKYIQQFTFENSFKLFKDVIANGIN